MSAKFNAEMLRLARDLRGMTQRELATLSGCTQGFISRLESFDKEPSQDQLQRIADILRLPVDFFLRKWRYSGLGISIVFFRKRQSALVSHIDRLQAEVCLRGAVVQELLEGVDLSAMQRSFQFFDIDDFDGDAERIANLVRASWRLPVGPISHLTAAIESAGGIVFRFSFGTRDIDAMGNWFPERPPMFFVNSDAPPDRVRFSLAHELGHVIMHRSASEEMEHEADRFASEFLMPRKDIMAELDEMTVSRAADLKKYWRVSMAALIRRSYQLGRIDRKKYQYLFQQMSRLGYRKREPVDISSEEPIFIRELVRVYEQDMGFSTSGLAQLVGLFEEDFSLRFGLQASGLRLA